MNSEISSTSTQSLPLNWIEKLFEKMLLDYGKKFTDQWGGTSPTNLVAHWSRELGGYSGEELRRGYKALAERDWPPTLPEFKRMCRPAIDSMVAYYEAMAGMAARENGEMGEWSSPAIYWAAVKVGAFDLKNMTYSQIKGRWERTLQDEIGKGAWSDIPEPRIALSAPSNAPVSQEMVARVKKELSALGASVKSEKRDHKEWARKILRRVEAGDKTVSLIQISFAKEALANGEKNG